MALLTLRDSAAGALTAVEAQVARFAQSAVRPIYRNKGLRPEHLGTCTFVEVDGVDYLLTAAHVVDSHEQHTLFVAQRSFVPITLTFQTTVAPGGRRLSDRIDFSFAEVDGSWRLLGIEPLALSSLTERADAPLYSAIGYPNSRNRKYNPETRAVRPRSRQFISNPVRDETAFRALGLSPDVHLALRRDPKFARSGGVRVNIFEPRGMSGGAVFGIYGLHSADVLAGLREPLIVPEAIVTEKSEKHQLLFGTRLAVIVYVMRRERRTAVLKADGGSIPKP